MSQTQVSNSIHADSSVPLFVSIPHSGEKIPTQTPWLKSLPEEILMADVDRYVDLLYRPSLQQLQIAAQETEWHRYAVDLNRFPSDVDRDSVVGAEKPSGSHSDGFHWVMTKNEIQLMPCPMGLVAHQELIQLIYEPFHEGVRKHYAFFKDKGFSKVYHIDAHSMPSLGTRLHKDPGEKRADIVVSDCRGQSCSEAFRDLVIVAYVLAGFKVGYNWPYLGGRLTEHYGRPDLGQHAIQVELNRSLYMDEKTKKLKPEHILVQKKISLAIEHIKKGILKLS